MKDKRHFPEQNTESFMNKDMLLSLFMQTWYSFKGSMLAGFHVKNLRLRVIGFTKKRHRH